MALAYDSETLVNALSLTVLSHILFSILCTTSETCRVRVLKWAYQLLGLHNYQTIISIKN